MKQTLALFLTMILLSGCYQSVDSYDIYRATKHCGSIENVYKINARIDGTETVDCVDYDKIPHLTDQKE